ncbi:MAG: hypothetical protein QM831_45825 [Kofleriaceae bacterium]
MADRSKTPTLKTHGDSPRGKARAAGHDDEDPTNVYESGKFDRKKVESGPIQVISKKTPGVSSGQIPLPAPEPAPQRQVKIRAISEVASAKVPQQDQLGYLAPPRDRNEVRARRRRDFVVWGSVCVILASAIALLVWFVARR